MTEVEFYKDVLSLRKFINLDFDVTCQLYDYFIESGLMIEQFKKLKIRKYASLFDYNNAYLTNHQSLSTAPKNLFPYKHTYGAGLLLGYKIIELIGSEK